MRGLANYDLIKGAMLCFKMMNYKHNLIILKRKILLLLLLVHLVDKVKSKRGIDLVKILLSLNAITLHTAIVNIPHLFCHNRLLTKKSSKIIQCQMIKNLLVLVKAGSYFTDNIVKQVVSDGYVTFYNIMINFH